MKKLFTLLALFALIHQVNLLAQITGVYEIRIANGSGGTLNVQMQCINAGNPCPSTSDGILDITFAIKWLNSLGNNMGNPSGSYGIIKSGSESVSGSYEYQIYQLNAAPLFFPENWNVNTWYTIATVTPSVSGIYEIAEPGFNPSSNPNFNVNGDDYAPAINGSASGGSMPIELLDFRAYAKSGDVALEWATASESNTSHFDIERSADGFRFQYLAQVKAAGFSTQTKVYAIMDRDPVHGNNYYRFKQMDLDGSYTYSPVVSAYIGTKEGVRIFPNPVNTGEVTVRFQTVQNGETSFRLFDALGKVVLEKSAETQEAEAGRALVSLDNIHAGVYFLEVNTGGVAHIERIIVAAN